MKIYPEIFFLDSDILNTAVQTHHIISLDEFVVFIFFKLNYFFLSFHMRINRSDQLDHCIWQKVTSDV